MIERDPNPRQAHCIARDILRHAVVSLLIALWCSSSVAQAQAIPIVGDVDARVQLTVDTATTEVVLDIVNASDTTYVFIPSALWLHRVTRCRYLFRLGRSSMGMVLHWYLERSHGRLDDCVDRMAYPEFNEAYPSTYVIESFKMQFVVIHPGQHARFRWNRDCKEDSAFIVGSACRMDTVFIPLRVMNAAMRQLYSNGLIEQTSAFREYKMDLLYLDKPGEWPAQGIINGESRSAKYIKYQADLMPLIDIALDESLRFAVIPPGPNATCTVLSR